MVTGLWRFLGKQRGDRGWDLLIRATGLVALLGIPILVVFPRLVPLVWLAVLAVPANSPLSPLIPIAYEPLIMEAAKYERPVWVTLVALGAYMYMEYLNWRFYGWVINWHRFGALRERRWVCHSVAWFARAPFTTVVVFAFTPLPFWVARLLALLHRYPIRRFMAATAVGRLPRLYLYAWLGQLLHVPTVILVAVIFGTATIVVAGRLVRGKPLLADTALDVPEARDQGGETTGRGRG